ncbi:CDP-diacylglycerol diphosphatase [Streptomyces sp. NPDC002054]|uniref:CDP-diacylglycerol diphosphatase n=1 Tax=Streptomyces sp. NPDC002054 TaxID=3154663 RepID=UPI003331B7AA
MAGDEDDKKSIQGPPDLCGRQEDPETLWVMARDCRRLDKDWIVSAGVRGELLIPTLRIQGIECPDICLGTAYNYWDAAWRRVESYGGHLGANGLGVNSAHQRSHKQLHIHMTEIVDLARKDLDTFQGKIGNPDTWAKSAYKVTGRNSSGLAEPHVYRICHVGNLSSYNFFGLLNDKVVKVLGEKMADQTLMVIPVSDKSADGYYVVNSSTTLSGGIGSCEGLLRCH